MNRLELENLSLTIPLTANAHQIARQFATEQNNNQTAKQVYLNTLAVLAVKSFLAELSYPADLEESQSWNGAVRSFKNAADLFISNLSHIECCPILPEQKSYFIPAAISQELRIAYVFVQFKEELNEVELLGFVGAQNPITGGEEISLQELEPIDSLIDYLYHLETATEELIADPRLKNYLGYSLSLQKAAEISAQFDRILKLPLPSREIKQALEILELTIDTEDLSVERVIFAQRIADNLAKIWQIEAPVWQKLASQSTPERAIITWLSQGVDELANSIGWLRVDWESSLIGARATQGQELERNQYLITRTLTIAGQNYELQIIPLDLQTTESSWRFQLRNAAPGGFIPGGFKLKLLSETGQDFPGNQDVARRAIEELYLDVNLETGEGLIWITEPLPDDYEREILRF